MDCRASLAVTSEVWLCTVIPDLVNVIPDLVNVIPDLVNVIPGRVNVIPDLIRDPVVRMHWIAGRGPQLQTNGPQ